MKKVITEIDSCWLCPHHEYYHGREKCGKKRRFITNQDEGQPIPDWCPLPSLPFKTKLLDMFNVGAAIKAIK